MAATAVGFSESRIARFYRAAAGKKAVMAISGAALFGFVIAHLIGNLQVFESADKFNAYSRFLKSMPALLWSARIGLLVMVILHIVSTVLLALRKNEARPIAYVKRKATTSSYASRTMYWSGPIVLAFIIYHLMQFTFGVGGTRYDEADAYGNLVAGFQVPVVSIFYIVAMGLLCMHLYHGAWSMFQSLGINHPRYTPWLKNFAKIAAILIFAGFVSIPAAVMAGVVR